MERWNGVGILPSPETERVELVSDASGSWGCAAVWGTQWWQWCWNAKAQSWHIAPKELLPVLLSCIVWGEEWSGKLIRCHCDNMAVVEVLNSGYSRDREMMHPLRCLFFIAEHFRIQVEAVHLPGKENGLADALSRNNIFCRHSRVQQITNPPLQTGTGTVSEGTARMDITALDRTVCQLYRQGLALSTQQETLPQLL